MLIPHQTFSLTNTWVELWENNRIIWSASLIKCSASIWSCLFSSKMFFSNFSSILELKIFFAHLKMQSIPIMLWRELELSLSISRYTWSKEIKSGSWRQSTFILAMHLYNTSIAEYFTLQESSFSSWNTSLMISMNLS